MARWFLPHRCYNRSVSDATPVRRKDLIFFLLVAFVLPAPVVFGVRFLVHPQDLSLRSELPIKGITALCAALGTWLVARRENRSLSAYGLPEALAAKLIEGALWGFAMLAAVIAVLHSLGLLQIAPTTLTTRAVFAYALGWAVAFLFVSLSEELTFRGFLLFAFATRRNFWLAALVTSLAFALAHLGNPGESAIGISQVFFIGLLFCFMIRRTGSLWFAIGFHASWDWAQSYFFGTADSGLLSTGHYLTTSVIGPAWLTGASTGPEGSLLSLAVIALCFLLIHFRFPRPLYPDPLL